MASATAERKPLVEHRACENLSHTSDHKTGDQIDGCLLHLPLRDMAPQVHTFLSLQEFVAPLGGAKNSVEGCGFGVLHHTGSCDLTVDAEMRWKEIPEID